MSKRLTGTNKMILGFDKQNQRQLQGKIP